MNYALPVLRRVSRDLFGAHAPGTFGAVTPEALEDPSRLLLLHHKREAPLWRMSGEAYSGIPAHIVENLDACANAMEVRIRWAHGPLAQSAGAPALLEVSWFELRNHTAGDIATWLASQDAVFTADTLRRYAITPATPPFQP